MIPLDWFRTDHTRLNQEEAALLRKQGAEGYPIQIQTREGGSHPPVPSDFIRGITEIQNKWLKLRNASPTAAFEIRRTQPSNLTVQYVAPTRRLERKVRTQLPDQYPRIELTEGHTGLPVEQEDTIGGGLLTTGRRDWYPLQTEFDKPPTDSVASALHRHAMQDTKFVVQVLFRPVAGKPVRRRYWRRRAYQRIGYLRKEKEKLWNSRAPTPREKRQADAIEAKAGTNRFHTSIRLLVIDAGQHTASRVKELAGAFNRFENPETGQYLDTVTVEAVRPISIRRFADAVATHSFDYWSLSFQSTVDELAALTAPPQKQHRTSQAQSQ